MAGDFLSNEHAWKFILTLAHITGLISLPNHYQNIWMKRIHFYYSCFVIFFKLIFFISSVLNIFIYSIKDSGEFCQRSFDVTLFAFLMWNSMYLTRNLSQFLHIVGFSRICVHHSRNKIVLEFKKWEKNLMITIISSSLFMWLVLVIIVPCMPKTKSELQTLKTTYNWKYPQNTLPIYYYVPCIDPSEPKYFIILYIMTVYVSLLHVVEGIISMGNLLLHGYILQVNYDMLNEYTRLIGTVHTDANNQRVFHTDIVKGQFVRVNLKMNTNKKSVLKNKTKTLRIYVQYEYLYLKQVIQYEQELRYWRLQLDSYLKPIWIVLIILMANRLCTAMYAVLIPGLLSAKFRCKILLEALIYTGGSIIMFWSGEILASTQLSWRSALYESFWYRCSRKTRKVFPLLILLSQSERYLCIKGLLPYNFQTLLWLIKSTYSVFNVLRIRRIKSCGH